MEDTKYMKNKIAYYNTPTEIVDVMLGLSSNINKSIIDTGYGDGAFINKIIEMNKSENITGIELDEEFYKESLNTFQKRKNIKLINDDFLNYEFNKKFDLVIGNPPYITNDNLPFEIKEKIKKLSGSGEGNIYYAFILKSIQILEENGELIYIVPYDFFYNTYRKNLRETLLKEGEFETIIDLGELNIFKNASPEIIIFKWVKRSKKIKNKINIFKLSINNKYKIVINNLEDCLKNNNTNIYFKKFEIPQFTKENNIWSLSDFKEYEKNIHLFDVANVVVGIVNGAEDIFSINNKTLKTFTQREKEKFIKTFIKSKNLIDTQVKDLNNNDYIFIDNKITEDELKKYKNIYSYLELNRNTLSNRYINKGKNWFNYLAIRNYKFMLENSNEYKILVPNITRKTFNWFSITNLPHLIGGDSLMIKGNTEEDTFLLFGILNSEYFTNYYLEKGAKKGKRILFNQKLLKEINIPDFPKEIKEKIILEVKQMINTNKYDFLNINKLINNLL